MRKTLPKKSNKTPTLRQNLDNRMKEWRLSGQQKKQALLLKKYNGIKVTKEYFINAKNKTITHTSNHLSFYLTVTYEILAGVLILIIEQKIPSIDNNAIADFINGTSVMIGGMLAIVFTFNTLVINFAVDQYPPEYYWLSGYNKTLDILYFTLGGLTITQFLLGLTFNGMHLREKTLTTAATTAVVFTAIYFLYLAFSVVRKRMNPIDGLVRIQERAINGLEKSEKRMNRYIELGKKKPGITESEIDKLKYEAFIYEYRSFTDLDEYLGYLFDYHTKLIQQHNNSAAIKSLTVIGNILIKFITVNSKSLMPLPNKGMMGGYTTLANTFMDSNFERLIFKSKFYIQRDDEQGMMKMASLFADLGKAISIMDFSTLRGTNPEFSRCSNYFTSFCDYILTSKSSNALFYFAPVLGTYAEAAIARSYFVEYLSLLKTLEKFALVSAAEQYSVVFDQHADIYNRLAAKCIDHEVPSQIFEDYTKSLNNVISSFLFCHGNDAYDLARRFIRPYEIIANVAVNKLPQASAKDNINKENEQLAIVHLTEVCKEGLEDLLMKQDLIDRMIILDISTVINFLVINMIAVKKMKLWARNIGALNTAVEGVMKSILWTLQKTKVVSFHYIDTVSEDYAKIGFSSLSKKDTDTLKVSAEIIYSLAVTSLNNSKGIDPFYNSPRILLNNALLTIVAIRREDYAATTYIRSKIHDFQKLYATKYDTAFPSKPKRAMKTSPFRNQFNSEMRQLIRNRQSRSFDPLADFTFSDIVAKYPQLDITHYVATYSYLKR
jgi:hypothetical protein